ncbi:Hypothetical predicted protein [Mytilus galloprovincialis]|uniref:Homologous recombination OB-fold protein OB-fold domain-containing protein n=1 Tax=Mytilus galloprovincialis TaxID=29158 RepID=A0A8B6H6B8_MYTGA|nr:Hypothetical predicted protein [Mytilus galloprovincialis]
MPEKAHEKWASPGSIKDNQQLQKQTVSTSPEILHQQNESVILSSQSGEEVFNEVAWQTLLSDLGEDGRKQMVKFSIATSFQKARKKLLPKGKVPLVIAVIESVDWQGSDASICLKDKSGRIHGTVHQSLMKEHQGDLQPGTVVVLRQIVVQRQTDSCFNRQTDRQTDRQTNRRRTDRQEDRQTGQIQRGRLNNKGHQCDLQPGTVVVLRQVSMISPTTRNHYLNVTPANVVVIYSNTSNGLRTIRNIEKNTSLNSVLHQVEPYISEDSNIRRRSGQGNMSTPGSLPNNCRHGNMSTPNSITKQLGQGNISTPSSISNKFGQGNMATPGSISSKFGQQITPSFSIKCGQGNLSTPGSIPNNSRNIIKSSNLARSDQTGRSMCVTTPKLTHNPTVHTPTIQQNSSNQTPQRPQSSNKFKFVKTPNILNTACNSVQSAGSHTAQSNHTGSHIALTPNLNNSQVLAKPTVPNNVNITPSVNSRVPNTPVSMNENKQNLNQASSSISLTHAYDERKISEKPYFSRNLCSTDFNSNKIGHDNTPLEVRNTNASNNYERNVPNVPSKSGNSVRQASNSETTECSASPSVKNGFRFKSSNHPQVTADICKTTDTHMTVKSNAFTTKNVLKHVRDPPRPCFEVDSMWHDDLSDDLLSQLSEEMM